MRPQYIVSYYLLALLVYSCTAPCFPRYSKKYLDVAKIRVSVFAKAMQFTYEQYGAYLPCLDFVMRESTDGIDDFEHYKDPFAYGIKSFKVSDVAKQQLLKRGVPASCFENTVHFFPNRIGQKVSLADFPEDALVSTHLDQQQGFKIYAIRKFQGKKKMYSFDQHKKRELKNQKLGEGHQNEWLTPAEISNYYHQLFKVILWLEAFWFATLFLGNGKVLIAEYPIKVLLALFMANRNQVIEWTATSDMRNLSIVGIFIVSYWAIFLLKRYLQGVFSAYVARKELLQDHNHQDDGDDISKDGQ